MLQARPVLMQRLGPTPQAILQINAVPAIVRRAPSEIWRRLSRLTAFRYRRWCNGQPGTAGAWGKSSSLAACPTHQHGAKQHGKRPSATGLMSSAATMQALVANQHARLVMNSHPVDEANLNPQFKQQFYALP
jgi:hypothetical protein